MHAVLWCCELFSERLNRESLFCISICFLSPALTSGPTGTHQHCLRHSGVHSLNPQGSNSPFYRDFRTVKSLKRVYISRLMYFRHLQLFLAPKTSIEAVTCHAALEERPEDILKEGSNYWPLQESCCKQTSGPTRQRRSGPSSTEAQSASKPTTKCADCT
jgi:hypothetical protein